MRPNISVITKTQIQIPEELARELRTFARRREWSLAETFRRGAELLLQVYPEPPAAPSDSWTPPTSGKVGWKGWTPAQLRDAVAAVQSYRQHPSWKTLAFPPDSRELHAELWRLSGRPGFARRRIHDVRTTLSLQAFGVTEFATANLKDFDGLGFDKVWNPVA